MDVKSAVSVFSKLEDPIDGNSIKDCYRLGKYNAQASRPRPLLIKFLRYSDASNLLNSKSKLSKPIYVKPDLTPEERAMESLLLKERKSLIEKGIGKQFIKIRNQSLFIQQTPCQDTKSTIGISLLHQAKQWMALLPVRLLKLKIISLNCRSIRSQSKRANLWALFNAHKAGIVLGCESHLDDSINS